MKFRRQQRQIYMPQSLCRCTFLFFFFTSIIGQVQPWHVQNLQARQRLEAISRRRFKNGLLGISVSGKNRPFKIIND